MILQRLLGQLIKTSITDSLFGTHGELMSSPLRERLIALLKEKSYRRRRVVLASGRESDFYVDGRQTTLNAEGACLVGRLLFDLLLPEVQGVGGLVIGADPIATAIAMTSWQRRPTSPVHAFLVRKEAKGHGTGRLIEGRENLPNGSKVCIVDDTVTTGGSLLRAANACAAEGLIVVQFLAIVDREEGGAEAIAERGLPFSALIRRAELES